MQHSLEWQLFHKNIYLCSFDFRQIFQARSQNYSQSFVFVQSFKNIVNNIGVDLFKIAYTLASAVAISGKENS